MHKNEIPILSQTLKSKTPLLTHDTVNCSCTSGAFEYVQSPLIIYLLAVIDARHCQLQLH